MARFLAGAAACFLLLTGAFFLWQSHAAQGPALPTAPKPRPASALLTPAGPLKAPEADPKSREERRFSRADKDKDGRIQAEEVLGARRKAFAKLDANGNGALSFDEWAAKTIEKFRGADKDRSGWLTPAEYALTAPPPPKHPVKCGR
ncbi:MAG TPA: EF-hand domain-containing protein [Sphingomicrobium sp.]